MPKTINDTLSNTDTGTVVHQTGFENQATTDPVPEEDKKEDDRNEVEQQTSDPMVFDTPVKKPLPVDISEEEKQEEEKEKKRRNVKRKKSEMKKMILQI